MEKTANDRVMSALIPLVAPKSDTSLQLQYIRVAKGYAYATDRYVYGRFAIDCLPDDFYKYGKDGIAAVDPTAFGYLCNIESVIPDRDDLVYSYKSAKLIKALASLREVEAKDRPKRVGIIVKNQTLPFDLRDLQRTVKAMQKVHGDDFLIEIYGIGVMLFRVGGDVVMLMRMRTLPDNPYTIELE